MPLDGSIAIAVVQFSSGAPVEVPRTVIDSQEALDGVVAKIEGMRAAPGRHRPGPRRRRRRPGAAAVRTDAKAVLCLSTDGTTNEGPDLDTRVAARHGRGIQRFSVIGIEDFGAAAELREHYGRHVYGGGAVTIARNTVEFASLIAGSCFGEAVTLRALEVNQGAQDWKNSKTAARSCARRSCAPSSRRRPGAPTSASAAG